jgi:hypothetical protein
MGKVYWGGFYMVVTVGSWGSVGVAWGVAVLQLVCHCDVRRWVRHVKKPIFQYEVGDSVVGIGRGWWDVGGRVELGLEGGCRAGCSDDGWIGFLEW